MSSTTDKCGRKSGKEHPSFMIYVQPSDLKCEHKRKDHTKHGCKFCTCADFIERIPR